jgi:galactosylceramidase
MKEAKSRNPNIILWGLPWAFPGWLDATNKNNPYSNVSATAEYVVDWVDGARREHGLHIAMVGCWNERPYSVDYLKELRRQLDARNLSQTGIIADDGHSAGNLATAMQKDPELMESVAAFGMHYPRMTSPPSAAAVAAKTGKPIFASEDYGVYFDSSGGKAWARLINQNFVRGGMSGTIAWNLVTSYYAPHPSASYGPCPSCNGENSSTRLSRAAYWV